MENFWQHLQNLTDAQSILSQGGFYLLLIVVFAETGLFFGFFLPGDYLLFMAGLLCSAGMFEVSIYTLIISLILAGILGNYTGYWFGSRSGPILFSRTESFFFKKRYVVMAEEFFDKYGGKALVLGRFFPIIRTFAPIFAGVVKFDPKKFAIFNVIGCAAWVLILTLSGFFLGKRYPEIKDYMQYVVVGLIVVTSLPLLVAYFKRKRLFEKK